MQGLDGKVVLITGGSSGIGRATALRLADLGARIVLAARHAETLDQVVEELFDLAPKNTYITITSDHGELFGEEGYFGHGPILHDKVLEVPFVEGQLR